MTMMIEIEMGIEIEIKQTEFSKTMSLVHL